MIQEAILESFWLNDLNALFRDCLAIPYAAEIEGPHAHTLGAYERVCGSNGTTFMSRRKIADFAGLPLKTFEKHLAKNIQNGWLINEGRKRRRTKTIRLSDKFKEAMRRGKRLHPRIKDPSMTWSMRVVFAYVANQINAQAENRVPGNEYLAPLPRQYSTIAKSTGLSLQTAKDAVTRLYAHSYFDAFHDDYGRVVLSLEEIEVKREKAPWSRGLPSK